MEQLAEEEKKFMIENATLQCKNWMAKKNGSKIPETSRYIRHH
jgi:hypothetical protein